MKKALLAVAITLPLLCGVVSPSVASAATDSASTRSNVFAGFDVKPVSGAITSAAGTFSVPSTVCTSANTGLSLNVVILNTALNLSGGTLEIVCKSGAMQSAIGAFVNGVISPKFPMPVVPGDVMQMRVAESVTKTTVLVTDLTTKVSKTVTGGGGTMTDSQIGDSVIGDSHGNPLGVTSFGQVPFTAVKVNGLPLNSASLGASAVNLVMGKTLKIATTALMNGNRFSLVFKHS